MLKNNIRHFNLRLLILTGLFLYPSVAVADLDPSITNAPLQVIIPVGSEITLRDVSPNASDPSLLLRITALSSNAWFDAIVPYHPTARGVYSDIPNRPDSERTDKNRNIAMLYASFHVYNSLMPQGKLVWRDMLTDAGLEPDDKSSDLSSPIGIGNTAGSSRIEPGFTPQNDLVLHWTSWSDFENDCGQSRLWSGVHFPDAIPAGIKIGHEIGDITYDFVQNLLEGHKN